MKIKIRHLINIASLMVFCAFFFLLSTNSKSIIAKAEDETLLNIDYRTTSFNNTEKLSYYHVSGSNEAHGVVPTKEWKNESEASQGYIIYKVNVEAGFVIDNLSYSMDALISDNANLDPSIPGNTSISVYLSQNSNSFVSPAVTFTSLSNSSYTYETDLTNFAKGYRSFYMKVELNHPTGTFVLNRIGTKLYSLLLIGNLSEKTLNCTQSNCVYYDCDFSSFSVLEELETNNIEIGNELSWTGLKLVSSATKSSGSIIFHINPYLENQLETLSLEITNSRFAYYFGDYGNYISFMTSFDGINYSLFDKKYGNPTAISSFYYDFSSFFDGQIVNDFYIKLEIGTTNVGCGFDDRWIILQNIQIKGKEASHDLVLNEDHYVCSECGKTFIEGSLNPIQLFVNNYMHMNDNTSGQCVSYYPLAKEAYLKLSIEQRRLFMTEQEYENARDRLISWASYHGEIISVETISSNKLFHTITNNNLTLMTMISTSALMFIISFVVLKQKKHYN